MVLFVSPSRKSIEELHEWSGPASFAYLYHEFWRSYSATVMFTSPKPRDLGRSDVELGFAAESAVAVQYLYYFFQLQNFLLKIKARRRIYYVYDSWCGARTFLPNETTRHICTTVNDYDYRELGKRSLKPSRCLYTVVPTQMSSLV